jgi:probable HAF family extracellular repeat protein
VTGAAYGINSGGQIVGESYPATGPYFHAFLYSGVQMNDLDPLGGESSATCINDLGQVAGSDSSEGAFLYSGGTMQYIPTLGSPTGINHAGQIVGSMNFGNGGLYRACMYSGGQVKNLGIISGYNDSSAYGINDAGLVVGWATNNDISGHAFLYNGGSMIDLNTLIDPSSGWTLDQALAINDEGQIVGDGYNSLTGETAFLLTPVPEPLTMIAVGMGIAGLGGYIRRRRMATK